MTVLDILPSPQSLFHSHSDLTRQIEELETHAAALRTAREDRALILEDLVGFAQGFAAELTAHIKEEEEEVFPEYSSDLNSSTRELLIQVYEQHRELEKALQTLLSFLKAAVEAEWPDDDLIESIYVRARILRYLFTLHSESEREFFVSATQAEELAR